MDRARGGRDIRRYIVISNRILHFGRVRSYCKMTIKFKSRLCIQDPNSVRFVDADLKSTKAFEYENWQAIPCCSFRRKLEDKLRNSN